MLEPRCPTHPGFTGDHIPGHHGLEEKTNKGVQSCSDCWELYRRVQERRGYPEARG